MQPPWVAPMLATLRTQRPTGHQWAWELKWDGVRAMAHVHDGTVQFTNRTGGDITAGYPDISHWPAARSNESLLIDGEIVAIDPATGRPSFQLLQHRMHVRDRNRIEELRTTAPATFVAFDLLHANGGDLTERSYLDRRAALAELDLARVTSWIAPPHDVGASDATWAVVEQFGLEGAVAKHIDSRYEIGRRSANWVKVKRTLSQSFVIGGWLDGAGKRAGTVGSLAVGVHDDHGDLHYCGNVGTGLSDRDLAALHDAFGRIATNHSPFVDATDSTIHFVQPIVVIDVRFTEWTNNATLRHPVFLEVRTDVDPASVQRVTH